MARKKKAEEVDEHEGLLKKLIASAPKGDGDNGMWEIARTTNLVMSAIKYVLKTGIDSFDDIVGGMPFGRMVELYGLESCGKTAMAIRCAARAQAKNICEVVRNPDDSVSFQPLKPEECKVCVVYVDNEQSLDEDGKLVVDGQTLDVIGCRFDTTNDLFKAIDISIAYQEEREEAEAEDGIKRLMLILVDTIASTSTRQELEQAWGTEDYPRQAKQISLALRKLTRRVNRHNVCIIFTNQVRTKFQQQQSKGRQTFAIQADDYMSVGGMALKYYASHRVFMYAMTQKYKLVPDAQFSAGFLIGFHTKKNRLRPPVRDGRMVLLFDKDQGGLHNVFSKLETLEFLGFVEVGAATRHTNFTLKFKKNGLIPTTFDPSKVETTLEEDDDLPASRRGSSRKDPSFKYRSEWPQFYTAHKADIDKLWEAAVVYAMATQGLDGSVQVEEETPAIFAEAKEED